MTKNRNLFIIIMIVTLVLLFEGIAYYILFIVEHDRTGISVIVYEDDKNWADLKEGAELAARNEENVDINFIVMPEATTAKEQKKIILDEINSGAKYVVTTAVDSYELSELLNGVYESKIEFVMNGTDDKNYKVISPDNYKMGYELGRLIVEEEGSDINVGIISIDDKKKSLNIRAQGIRVALGEANVHYEIWNNSIIGDDIYQFVKNKINNNEVDAIIVLNESVLDAVTAVVSDNSIYDNYLPVYAMVHSEKSVYYLDSKQLKYLVYPDEFGAGYAAVTELLHPAKIRLKDDTIAYSIVKRADMYSGQYEKVLFPFVK
ncbi:MAG: substrate-binding domain-containing protein [Lachnospiraceae bacterium]|nr:substrate-binding domain-containing protein [Candidatus Colinaster scatohippi]